jgi:hypothetical protein
MAYQRQGTLAELQQSGGIGDIVQALQQFAPQLGVNLSDHYTVNQSAEGDGTGNFIQQQLSPELMERLAGYTFGRTGGINQDNYWDVMKDGQVVNRYQTGSHSGLDSFMSNGGALLPALAGMALFGTAGVGGGTGLMGGSAMSMGDAIAASGAAETMPAVGLTEAGVGGVGLTSADKAAMFGPGGYGPGMTGIETAAFDAGLSGGGIMDLVKKGGSGFLEWAAKNPHLALQLGGMAVGALKGDKGGGGGGAGIGSLVDQSAMTKDQAPAFQRQYVAAPQGYRPGIDPEHKYFK